MRVLIPLRLASVANVREHWATKARRVKSERRTVAWIITGTPRPTLPVIITLTRIGPRAFDKDNNVSALKSVQDEVAKWLNVDDRDSRITWLYSQRKEGPRQYAVEVEISGVAEVWP